MRGIALTLLLAGCYGPTFAPGTPCSATGDCPGDLVCDTSQSPPTCVESLPDGGIEPACTDDSDCFDDAPICDLATRQCRGCVADSECASDICHELDGTCVDESLAVYAAPDGASDACTRTAPCSLDVALNQLSTLRPALKLAAGVYARELQLDGTGERIVSGPSRDPAEVTLTVPFGRAIEIAVLGDAIVEGLTIAESPDAGVVDRGGSVTLSRLAIERNGGIGIDHRQGQLFVSDCTITGNDGVGIVSNGGGIDIERTLVDTNAGGGIDLANGGGTVTNTVIRGNGLANSNVGGLRIGGGAVIELVTIVRNTGGLFSGVNCQLPASIASSIVADNGGAAQMSPLCSARYSLFFPSGPTDMDPTNLIGEPRFDNPETGFHLVADSPGVDAADPASAVRDDFDGDDRPAGAAPDIGADELR
ncbi:MAG TPA: right-handed parallel beta-helix repeat-containing protein [Kofleriaceae bacterium]|nr:right-handed parallel beta-helix repeat-containing protein [Kofleriaceae bacterium]